MTKRYFKTTVNNETLMVDCGYDRPLDHYFLNVYAPGRHEEEQNVYVSMYDPRWMATGRSPRLFGGLTLDDLQQVFREQGITPPEGLIPLLIEDAAVRRGNDIKIWE